MIRTRVSTLIVAAVALSTGLGIAQAQDKAAGPAPKVEAAQPEHNFGEVWVGSKVDHTFEIKNSGDAVLKITRVKPGCGCTVAKEYTREIPPGGVGQIPVTVSTKAARKATKTVNINVESNDPASPFKLVMTGKVKQRFKTTPENGGNFGRVRPHEEQVRRMSLTNQMDSPVELSLATAKIGAFNAELITKTPGQEYELVVRSKPPYADKTNRASFKLATNLDDKSTVDVNVNLFALPLIEVRPTEVIIASAADRSQKECSDHVQCS